MPSPGEIVAGLTAIANEGMAVAVAWHFLIAGALGAMFLGWRPSARFAAVLLAALPASVSVFAFAYGNVFNGAAFAMLTLVLLTTGLRSEGALGLDTPGAVLSGAAIVTFGFVYPHFLASIPVPAYAIAAPTGLVPCPTLAVLIGFTVMAMPAFSKRWALTLAGYGVFYGLFGALRLNVMLDVGLLAGAAWLLARTLRTAPTRTMHTPARAVRGSSPFQTHDATTPLRH